MEKTILIVDDEAPIVEMLKFNLQKSGYKTMTAYDGRTGLELALNKNPDLILLDVMLPKMDGFEVCRKIREADREVPILMLTAREEEIDKVFGLESGADDYITKPFSVRELMARVKANLRRGADQTEGTVISIDSLEINTGLYEVKKNGVPIELTLREFELLKFLASQPGRIFSREMLLEKVWGYEYFGDVRTVDVTVRRLREKVEDNPAAPERIMTKRGVGYYYNKD